MKPALYLTILAAFVGCDRAGRYQIVSGQYDIPGTYDSKKAEAIFKVDTITGRTWEYQWTENGISWFERFDYDPDDPVGPIRKRLNSAPK